MKKILLAVALLTSSALAQTTATITGTIKDLTQTLVTSGKVTFTLQPASDTTISGLARFVPSTTTCLINGSGLVKAQDGVSTCIVTLNTALQPTGTYYQVTIWPFNVKTSTFNFYAINSSYDITTVVPTPTTSPADNFVDIFSNQTIGGAKTFTGPVTLVGGVQLCHTFSAVRCIDPANQAGWSGSTVDAWIAAAVADLGSGGGTVQIASGNYTVGGTIAAASNVNIECDHGHTSVLLATPSLNAPLYLASSVTSFRLGFCVLDGNRNFNSNSNTIAQVTGSSGGKIVDNKIRNTLGNALYMVAGVTFLDIIDNEIYNFGPSLPAQAVGINAGAQPGNPISHIRIRGNDVHDGSIGIDIQASITLSSAEEDWEISDNRIHGNANDGISVFSTTLSHGPQIGFRVINNETYCNGWPANGTGFSSNCTPGLLQTGGTASSSGVGIDFNSPVQEQGIISLNRSHDNYFEGIDVGGFVISTVNVSGTAVSVVGGDPANTAWKLNQAVRINGNQFLISSCSSTSSCTLTTSAGPLSNAQMVGNANRSRTTISNNQVYNNGRGNGNTSGSGGADIFGYGDVWSGNLSYLNNALGFDDFGSVLTTHIGDTAISNGQSTGGFHDGILCQACLFPKWISIQADDPLPVPQQGNGGHFDPQTSGGFASGFTVAEPSFTAFVDAGFNNLVEISSGNACTNAELTLSGGWGNTASVGSVAGQGPTCSWTITSSGTGQAANPTVTDTLTNPLASANYVCSMTMTGGTGTSTLINQTARSGTAPVFTFGGTPVASSTYIVLRRCGP